jgi:hypothetical protein
MKDGLWTANSHRQVCNEVETVPTIYFPSFHHGSQHPAHIIPYQNYGKQAATHLDGAGLSPTATTPNMVLYS